MQGGPGAKSQSALGHRFLWACRFFMGLTEEYVTVEANVLTGRSSVSRDEGSIVMGLSNRWNVWHFRRAPKRSHFWLGAIVFKRRNQRAG